MRVLFLDDDPNRWKSFSREVIGKAEPVWVETAKDAIDQLKTNGPFNIIFLDHDLGGKIYAPSGEGTGWEVAKWIVDNIEDPCRVIVHSMNPVGARNIKDLIPEAEIIPFHLLLTTLIDGK